MTLAPVCDSLFCMTLAPVCDSLFCMTLAPVCDSLFCMTLAPVCDSLLFYDCRFYSIFVGCRSAILRDLSVILRPRAWEIASRRQATSTRLY